MRKTCSESDCSLLAKARGLCSTHYQRYKYRGTLGAVAPALAQACTICGSAFPEKHDYRRIYCSQACSDRAALKRLRESRTRLVNACTSCGGPMRDKRPHARFCSVKCGEKHRGRRLASAARAARGDCVNCGTALPPYARRFCGRSCSIAYRRPETYGLTPAELAALLAQHGVCAICHSASWGRKGPQIDHDHASGRVRGVLCINCNNGLGRFHDDPSRLRAAAAYLEAVAAP